MYYLFWEILFWVGVAMIASLALVTLGYVLARAMSFAHFRTKLEYFRSLRKESDNNAS